MNQPTNDDERLAALLDGRLNEGERQQLLARLAASDDDYDVLTHTASVLRELEEEDEVAATPAAPPSCPAVAVPPSARASTWRRSPRWSAVAAGLAVLGLAGVWLSRGVSAAVIDPVAVAQRLEQSGHGLPPGWRVAEQWEDSRGTGTDVEAAAKAARAGALLVDVAVAAADRDSVGVREHAREALGLETITMGSPLLRIMNAPGAPTESTAVLLRQATDRFGERLGWPELSLGAWTEGARIAAHRRNAAYFRSADSRQTLKSAAGTVQGDSAALAAVARVRAAAQAETVDWKELADALDSLLQELTN